MHFRQDTIVARATPFGSGAIGIIRISGSLCTSVLEVLLGKASRIPQSHMLKVRKLYAQQQMVDEGMVAFFKSPASFSGEDMAELYVHGSEFIISQIIGECLQSGCRLADPGEFTQRAFLNGKMDLVQAEAVADLIASESKGAHLLALNQLKGGVSNKIADLREQVLNFAALIELELDFGEEDVEFASREELHAKVIQLQIEVQQLLGSFKSGNAIKEGVPVAIVGKPNAGKSTLLNVLLGEERAIVTDIPGTTRDTIEEFFNVEGIRFRLIDTAGIRKSTDKVEEIGIQRTFETVAKATLVLLVVDVSSDSQEQLAALTNSLLEHTQAEIWIVANKTDLVPGFHWPNAISIAAGKGDIGNLMERLNMYAGTLLNAAADTTISNTRHADALRLVLEGLGKVLQAMHQGLSGDILAFELRNAMAELGKITGIIDSDEVLGTIFGKFCIGK